MMTNTISFPSQVGATLISAIGRSCLWLMKKYSAAPFTATAAIALALGLSMAANNALYGQVDHHPAPLFFGSPATNASSVRNVEVTPPATIAPPPAREVTLTDVEPAATVQSAPLAVVENVTENANSEVSNSDLANAQRHLQTMGLFNGDIDGFYGPKTAEAIRAFEMRNGMTPKGDMSRPVIDAILRADATDSATINAARNTARNGEVPTATGVAPEAAAPDTEELVAGQRALQALLTPQADSAAPTALPGEGFSAPADTPAETPVAEPSPTVTSQPVQSPSTDTQLIENIQKGLASLGFLHSRIDGVAGEETARAIRNFEVFNNYEVTGAISPELVDLLKSAGADI